MTFHYVYCCVFSTSSTPKKKKFKGRSEEASIVHPYGLECPHNLGDALGVQYREYKSTVLAPCFSTHFHVSAIILRSPKTVVSQKRWMGWNALCHSTRYSRAIHSLVISHGPLAMSFFVHFMRSQFTDSSYLNIN